MTALPTVPLHDERTRTTACAEVRGFRTASGCPNFAPVWRGRPFFRPTSGETPAGTTTGTVGTDRSSNRRSQNISFRVFRVSRCSLPAVATTRRIAASSRPVTSSSMSAPGRVDSPPTSTMVAPRSTTNGQAAPTNPHTSAFGIGCPRTMARSRRSSGPARCNTRPRGPPRGGSDRVRAPCSPCRSTRRPVPRSGPRGGRPGAPGARRSSRSPAWAGATATAPAGSPLRGTPCHDRGLRPPQNPVTRSR